MINNIIQISQITLNYRSLLLFAPEIRVVVKSYCNSFIPFLMIKAKPFPPVDCDSHNRWCAENFHEQEVEKCSY
jgi:hypothetical protein